MSPRSLCVVSGSSCTPSGEARFRTLSAYGHGPVPPHQPTSIRLDEPLLSVSEVAALLGISRGAVYGLCRRQGDPLPTVRVGSVLRVQRSSLERWLTRHSR